MQVSFIFALIFANCCAFVYEQHDFNMSDGMIQCSVRNGKIFVNGVYKGDLNAYGAQLLNDYNLQMKQWSDNLRQNILNTIPWTQKFLTDSNFLWSGNNRPITAVNSIDWPGAAAVMQPSRNLPLPTLPSFCYS
uniref:Pepsin inhibitor-3-like repeated domain-containing protein n=1 Tax=Parascaris univalens TaxID=6257 RepID=A0A915AAZ4_PARUN